MKFADWLKRRNENFGGSANDPSNVEDEGDGGDGVEKRMEKPGAFPTYSLDGQDLPITAKNRRNKIGFAKKGCGCK